MASLKVKQITSGPRNDYIKAVPSGTYFVGQDKEIEENFFDSYINFNWQADKYYYLAIPLQLPGVPLSVTPKLMTEGDDILTQTLRTIWLPGITGTHFLEMVISPDTSGYNQLVFTIAHMSTGYSEPLKLPEAKKIQLYTIENVIGGRSALSAITKIGIQGNAGMLTCINGEGIRIGPSQILQISKVGNFSFDFIGIMPRQGDTWLLDYQYME